MPAALGMSQEYKLTDLLSSAGATIGVIIAGTIFLQFLSTKQIELIKVLRELTGSYRGTDGQVGRHGSLQSQIRNYRWRLSLLNWASSLAAVAMLCLLTSVLAGGLSMVFPEIRAIKVVGTVALLTGLLLIGTGVSLELVENMASRQEILAEVSDLDDEVKKARSWR